MDENNSKQRKRDSGNAGRCTKARSKKNYSKKRKFHGKRTVTTKPVVATDDQTVEENIDQLTKEPSQPTVADIPPVITASSSKIIDIDTPPTVSSSTSSSISGYRLIDVSILANVFNSLSCPECRGVKCLMLNDINKKKRGLSRQLELKCSVCLYSHNFFTSARVKSKNKKGGPKFHEVNVRANDIENK